ncbi:MAG: AarF/ABC1/UbiB kinase family protein [Rhodospirillales bacterium]|nr:AarF/ABC1/UbiB kinase family protein [Rhodospirillales bacterium]
MTDWDEFRESVDFGALVPPAFARFRPAIVDGLAYFLEHLDSGRAFEILCEQAMLPASASIEQRLVAIARHCPVLHKLGQVLARDRRLPSEFRRLLQDLETMPADLGIDDARRMIEAEIGPLAAQGLSIDEPPLAEASVAVVVPFSVSPPPEGGPDRRGVFKLLKDGIEAKLNEELALLRQISVLLDERCEAYGLPRIDYEGTFEEVSALLAREVRLDREQAHMAIARETFADMPSIVIPEVYPFSTPRLTAMQRIDGRKVTEAKPASVRARRKLASLVFRALVVHPIWSTGESSLFHADPHAGNLFSTDDGRLAILDWSLVGRLTKSDRVCLTQILVGALTLDSQRIRQSVSDLAGGRCDEGALCALVDNQVGRLSQGAWPGLTWAMDLLDDAVTQARCRFGGDLVIFRKALQTLDGVVADISEDCHPDRILTIDLLRHLTAEVGLRAWALPFSRNFATHFSNLDLAQLIASAPLIGTRQWFGVQARLLAGWHNRSAA